MSRLIPSITLAGLLAVTTGCALVGAGAGADTKPEPYKDSPPEAGASDPAFEQEALDWAKRDGKGRIEMRWALLDQDWRTVRQEDSSGQANIVSRVRYVWVGGPVLEAKQGASSQPGDCQYSLIAGYQQHMGGGEYGATEFTWDTGNVYPYLHRMRCETDAQIAAAAPPNQ